VIWLFLPIFTYLVLLLSPILFFCLFPCQASKITPLKLIRKSALYTKKHVIELKQSLLYTKTILIPKRDAGKDYINLNIIKKSAIW